MIITQLSWTLRCTLLLPVLASCGLAAAPLRFNEDIRPILSENCFKCHGPDDAARKAKLRLDVREEALKPAKSGQVPIVPRAPEKSELVTRITTTDSDERMPPLKSGKQLTPRQVDLLRRWIAEGAAYATHWAYVKPTRPPVPKVKNKRWPRNPIDHFILARLEREGLKPSPAPPRELLIRRVSLDLTGLPPTLAEVEQFVGDRSPQAYEHLVDRLLAKPAFGEHWARLWLDLARYADSAGYADDPPRTIWPYRDYVIRSFNANKPFDRFTLEQIAGDLLDETDEDDAIATAFHRNTMTNNEGGTNDEEFRNAAIIDRANTTMAVWMGTSLACAECHNHKYDPISNQEYFRFFAFFNNTQDADLKDESPFLEIYSAEQKQQRREWQSEITRIENQFKIGDPQSLTRQAAWEKHFPREQPWAALQPASFSAKSGGTIIAPDGETVEIAPVLRTEVYRVRFPLTLKQLTGLRLVTTPSVTLPGAATANSSSQFAITRVSARVIAADTNAPAGRYVRLELPGKEKYLSLAEVQVFQGKMNLGLRGQATQSSTNYDGDARLAIDGNTDGDYERAKSTTHTDASEDPWWELDLKKEEPIERIVLWNRTDNELHDRLTGFRLKVLDSQRKVIWEQTVKEPPKPSSSFALDGGRVLPLASAFADGNQAGSEVASVIEDKDGKKGWELDARANQAHTLTLLLSNALDVPPGWKLELTLEQKAQGERCPPARFRVSASEDRRISEYAGVPPALLEVLTKTPEARTDAEKTALNKYYRAHVDPELETVRSRLQQLKKQLAQLKPETVPVMREMAGEKRRKTHLQLRGNYQALGEEVSEGVPVAFHPLAPGSKPNRLSLAHWLVDPANALTGRVIANRFWEQIFGIGIVRTSEDFGTQGDLPTHPELLDWLATELPAQKWDVKAFLKLLVTSATYCQSSRVTPQLQERDPDNLLLARGARFRMSAEVVRDQALAASGLLSFKMHGPPVRPPRPASGLSAAFGSSLDWTSSEGEDRYRRALYIEWRRTSPYPSMATFDAPNREVCALRRPRSNTPLQALVTLNDPVYVETAQALGRRMAQAPGSVQGQIRFGFRLCLARQPRDNELQRLVSFYDQTRAGFVKTPELAKKIIGATKETAGLDHGDLAAWTAVGNVLLNLDELLMRP